MTKTQENYLDKLLREVMATRHKGVCEKCGRSSRQMNVHHFHGRRHLGIRWTISNLFALCNYCHYLSKDSVHQNPAEFTLWAIKTRGQQWYDDLLLQKNTIHKPDFEMIKLSLLEMMK